MGEPKTRRTGASVDEFVAAIPDPAVRQDCVTLIELMRRRTGSEPQMWGEGIVGFGQYDLVYADGRRRAWPCHRAGESCLWVKRLSDIDSSVLDRIAATSLRRTRGCDPH